MRHDAWEGFTWTMVFGSTAAGQRSGQPHWMTSTSAIGCPKDTREPTDGFFTGRAILGARNANLLNWRY